MIKKSNKEIDLRLGKGREFIKSIVLNDDTIINNMQCDLKAKKPTLRQLKKHEQGEDFLNIDLTEQLLDEELNFNLDNLDLEMDLDELDLDLESFNNIGI